MKPFSLLVKPAGADCNMRCAYCFYLEKGALYPDTPAHRMNGEVLEAMIAGYMATAQDNYAFGWQGGEPTLMGADFFRRVTDLQVKHGRGGAVVSNGLQTNATAVTDALAAHMGRYKFLVGVSLDGPADIHDFYRTRAGGGGSHADVIQGIECLRRHDVAFNILTLVTPLHDGRAAEVYRYLRDSGFLYHQYIPCVEFEEDGRPKPFTVSGESWGRFLCDIFDAWFPADTRHVSVRLFDSLLAYLANRERNVCHMARDCRQYFLVEHNGDVYPCDFFVEPELKLGNVTTDSWHDMQASDMYREFGRQKSQWHQACEACEFLTLCSGDCLKNRFHGRRDPRQVSWLCAGWQMFFRHALPRLRRLADEIRRERRAATPAGRGVAQGRPGRNDPCPCGSGRKFKSCCME